MSEARDEATGQFTESGADLTGEAYEMHKAGYVLKPDEPMEKGPEDPAELAESLADARGAGDPEPAIEPPEPEDPDAPKEAQTQRQFIEELADRRVLHEAEVERRGHEEVAEYADALRAHLNGIDVGPKAEPPEQDAQQTVKTAEPYAVEGLDPDLAKVLQHPQVREAVEAQFSEANRAREHYSAGLESARVSTLATLAEVVPHLAGLPPQQFEEGLALLSQVDPPAFDKAMNILGRAHAITQAQQQAQQQQAWIAHQQFEASVETEDARLTELFGGDKAAADEANNATISYLAEHGFSRRQMLDVFKANPVLSTAEARRTIWEAARYRDIQKAKVVASARAAPAVQRPGVAVSAADRNANAISERTARSRAKIDGGRGDARDLAAILGSLRRA